MLLLYKAILVFMAGTATRMSLETISRALHFPGMSTPELMPMPITDAVATLSTSPAATLALLVALAAISLAGFAIYVIFAVIRDRNGRR